MSDDSFTEDDDAFQLTPDGFEMLHGDFDLDLLSDEHLLILRFADAREAQELAPPTVAEAKIVETWYNRVITESTLLEMVLNGEVYPEVIDDEVYFKISPKGMRKYKGDENVEDALG